MWTCWAMQKNSSATEMRRAIQSLENCRTQSSIFVAITTTSSSLMGKLEETSWQSQPNSRFVASLLSYCGRASYTEAEGHVDSFQVRVELTAVEGHMESYEVSSIMSELCRTLSAERLPLSLLIRGNTKGFGAGGLGCETQRCLAAVLTAVGDSKAMPPSNTLGLNTTSVRPLPNHVLRAKPR